MSDRSYLNVKHTDLPNAEVNVTGITRMGDIQDAIKAKMPNVLADIDSPQIQLFDKDGHEITDVDDIPDAYFKKIKEGGLSLALQATPPPSRDASSVGLFGPKNPKRQKTDWSESCLSSILTYDPHSLLFQLDSEYLANTGLPDKKKLVLYCRSLFHKQFDFLVERVIKEGVFGWILGPPGTGKSTTALAFASTLDRNEWTITWIHLFRSKHPICVRLEGETKKSRTIHPNEIANVLEAEVASKNHIVLIDGYATGGNDHIAILKDCDEWRDYNRENRRLVVVCSMSSRFKSKPEEDLQDLVEEFYVYSWTTDEFISAVNLDDFFTNVKESFDSIEAVAETKAISETESVSETESASKTRMDPIDLVQQQQDWRKELVASKFYFAGGSSRFMFLFPTAKVIQYLQNSVDEISDFDSYVRVSTGPRADGVVNRLFSLYPGLSRNDGNKVSIASQYAGYLLATKLGPDLIYHLAKTIRHDCNPSMDGWMLEMWFFACLPFPFGGVKLSNLEGKVIETWATNSTVVVLGSGVIPRLSDSWGIWLKPEKWNQGGYDAIFIDKSLSLVRFVQVTRGGTHSFKISFFASFLECLLHSEESFEVKTLEIFFVVAQEKLASFKIGVVTGEGLLAVFPGWEKGKEKDMIKVVGLDGWSK